MKIHGELVGLPNGIKTSEYDVWRNMRRRCGDTTNKSYSNYGGRGINVCSRWNVFSKFLEDMGRRPSKKHSINRVDNNGNYEPQNCEWADAKNQSRNRTSSSRSG